MAVCLIVLSVLILQRRQSGGQTLAQRLALNRTLEVSHLSPASLGCRGLLRGILTLVWHNSESAMWAVKGHPVLMLVRTSGDLLNARGRLIDPFHLRYIPGVYFRNFCIHKGNITLSLKSFIFQDNS
jgi:hypothetical protein